MGIALFPDVTVTIGKASQFVVPALVGKHQPDALGREEPPGGSQGGCDVGVTGHDGNGIGFVTMQDFKQLHGNGDVSLLLFVVLAQASTEIAMHEFQIGRASCRERV